MEIVDVCSCDLARFPEEPIYWADACVVVYDITSKKTLAHAVELLQRVHQLRSQNQIPLVLLGNKADLEHLREVCTIYLLFIIFATNKALSWRLNQGNLLFFFLNRTIFQLNFNFTTLKLAKYGCD